MYKGGDIQSKYIKPNPLVPIICKCEICGKPKANYNHVMCSKIKQQRFMNGNIIN